MKPHPVLGAALALILSAPAVGAQTVPESREEIALSFAPLVREASPAVVNIYAQRVVQGRSGLFSGDPFFEQFFRDLGPVRPRVENSLGSGVILRPDGLVVSNYHVVGGATDIRVVLTDRREYSAEVIMADEASDLAVLRLSGASDLPALDLRDSDAVEAGELVMAIGNPFGVGQTVTSGIVSALARSSASLGQGYFIQTDAAINPGNSGGALIDMNGRLIGVNTAILSRSGGSNGIGFAIPANLVAEVLRQAEAGGTRFERPWAGVGGQEVDAAMAEALGLDRPGGIVITELHPQSPFGAAGLQPGDVILALGGAEVNSPQEVMFRLAVAGIGQETSVEYARDGARAEVTLRLDAAPGGDGPALTITEGALAGLSATEIDPSTIVELDLPLAAQGVVVTGLEGPLLRSGLAAGDVILGINGVAVETLADLAELSEQQTRNWALDVLRQGQRVRLRFRF
ncbi:Do family serine endopeptidase [Szabonella alba]|uniref:Do family serine endopeptidase n=1 Tax=Szabonella alba TaxID=2804194 RepID=A0A8K0Y1W3_9RHOB|nr:Do family serine endopeptidase [Szabonella alba]MBL4918362.1 Do family serine endopeptidase [Szabonella alba]